MSVFSLFRSNFINKFDKNYKSAMQNHMPMNPIEKKRNKIKKLLLSDMHILA
jgi:hypothetical protein